MRNTSRKQQIRSRPIKAKLIFRNNLIHCINLVSDGRVSSNSELKRQSITLEFALHFRANNLTPLKQLTKRQIAIHKLIQFMHKEGMGYRTISDFLNRSGIKTHTNKTWSNSKVHSNLKRMQERKERIAFRNKTYPSAKNKFRIKGREINMESL